MLAAVGLLIVVPTFTPLTQWWTHWLTGPRWDRPSGDTLIVLGGAAAAGNLMGYSSYWRSVYAVDAWRTAKFRRIVFSGSDGIAESMAAFLQVHEVPSEVLAVEKRARSTEENAAFVKEMLPPGTTGRIALMTSDFHMRRSLALFERAGFRNLIVIPVPDAGKRATNWLLRWEVCIDLATETAKLLVQKLTGRL